ncbi:MAG TPA: hypothetical protein VHN14_33020 [Kofleriaceae bacterium]|nr:hypothetical protein [Kofleriaceae bacterium]
MSGTSRREVVAALSPGAPRGGESAGGAWVVGPVQSANSLARAHLLDVGT